MAKNKAETKAAIERNLLAASGKLVLGIVVVLVILLVVFAGAVLYFGRGLTNQQFFVTIALLSLVSTIPFFFIFKTSTAEVWGEKSGWNLKLGGPIAGAAAMFIILWSLRPGPESRTVRITANENRQQLAGPFWITEVDPNCWTVLGVG